MAWLNLGSGRRYDPDTHQAQYQDPQTGEWHDLKSITYDPTTGVEIGGQRVLQPGEAPEPGEDVFRGQWGPMLPQLEELQQIYRMQQLAKAQGGTATGTAAPTQAAPRSYWGVNPTIGMGTSGTWNPATGTAAGTAGTAGGAAGGAQSGGSSMATTTAGQIPTGIWGSVGPADISEWQKWYGANVGKTIIVNGQPRTINQDIQPDELWNAFRSNDVSFGQIPGVQQPGTAIGGPGQAQPESVALAQMAQIDPMSEALRQGLAASYLGPLAQGAPTQGPPSAAQLQSYLDLYNQIDPTGLAARRQLGTDLATQEALGAQLDPVTMRQIEQSVRLGQAARGNVYGTPQLVQEAMTTGQAGLALQQQRQQALQSYLSSGQDVGTVAANLYQQGLNNYLNQMGNYRAAQQAALGYLGSGATPYQAGASYLNTAEQRAAAAAQGGAAYNPQGPSPYYTGAGTSSFPQYGLDMSQLANQWYQSMNYANLGYGQLAANQQKGGFSGQGAGMGAAKGALSGGLTGLAAGPWGALIGAGVGAVTGGLQGGFSG